MCNADSGWPLAYFQVTVSILIFGAGIPSLFLQALVPEDLRDVVRRHFPFFRWGYLFILFIIVVLMIFLWIIHPCDSTQIRLFANILSKYGFDQWDEVLITVSVIGLVFVWYLQIGYRRDRLLSRLEKKCNRRIQRKVIPDAQILEDIRYLGEQGKTRGDKIRLFEIIERLAYKIEERKYYKGNALEDIIHTIELTLQKDTDVVSFTRGILTLKHIVENEPKRKFDSSADTGAVIRALGRLVDAAIAIDNERPARMILETVNIVSQSPDGNFSESSLALFELGAAALDHGRFLVAVETLNKLETITCHKEPVDVVKSPAYLGLIAHFRARKGSARRFALASLKRVKFSPSRSKCLISAQEFFFRTARFTTADLLSKMITEK